MYTKILRNKVNYLGRKFYYTLFAAFYILTYRISSKGGIHSSLVMVCWPYARKNSPSGTWRRLPSTTRARKLLFYRLLEHAVQTDVHKSNERRVDTPLRIINYFACNSDVVMALASIAMAICSSVTFILAMVVYITSKKHEKETKQLINELKITIIMNASIRGGAVAGRMLYEEYKKELLESNGDK